MASSTAGALRELERIKGEFGSEVAARRRALIAQLRRANFRRPAQLLAFHEALCFARAYPDSAEMLALVDRTLDAFGRRPDVQALRDELWDSGLAGTDIWYSFYWATARWLVQHWPGQLAIDWDEWSNRDQLLPLLPLLVPYTESPALDEVDRTPAEWLAGLKGPRETDAEFLVRRIDKMALDEFAKEALYDALDVPLMLLGRKGAPSRTTARSSTAAITFQRQPLDRSRPDLLSDVERPPLSVRTVSRREALSLMHLAKISMITRSRDLDAFCNADPSDVRLVDCGCGLSFALMGARPERRLMIESSYGMLTLQNGLPIGYVLISAVLGSAAIAYNVFDTFRGGEAGRIFGRVLAVARHVFGVDSFSIDPYQLGHHNDEGLRSGAWWFYQKLGFRPADPGVARLMRRELAHMKKRADYRSDLDTMRELVADYMHFHLGDPRDDVLGKLSLGNVGLAVSQYLARRFGADREHGLRTCADEAAALCGTGPDRSWTRAERLWWQRWSPVLMTMPGIARWTAAERRAVVEVVRAKGGRHESQFVLRLDAHEKLRRALVALAAGD